jgi:hypothetical protein
MDKQTTLKYGVAYDPRNFEVLFRYGQLEPTGELFIEYRNDNKTIQEDGIQLLLASARKADEPVYMHPEGPFLFRLKWILKHNPKAAEIVIEAIERSRDIGTG